MTSCSPLQEHAGFHAQQGPAIVHYCLKISNPYLLIFALLAERSDTTLQLYVMLAPRVMFSGGNFTLQYDVYTAS
jgi:hypothetical protein